MNLHGIVAPYVAAVNPRVPVTVQVSAGTTTRDDGTPEPSYAGPVALTGSIAANSGVLVASAVASGIIQPGQTLSGAGVATATQVHSQLSGVPGGIGTYGLSRVQSAEVASEPMSLALSLLGQVQPLTKNDLAQLDGINLGGVKWKIYLNGNINAVVRPERKGGDLVTISSGPHRGVWLTVMILESWADWCSAAIVQQNGA